MLRYFTRRLLQTIALCFVMSLVIFGMLRLIPGDAATIFVGIEGTEESIVAIRRELGLDRPVYIQYLLWLQRMTKGDFGTSMISKQPVMYLFKTKLPATLMLTLAAIAIGMSIAFPLGVISGIKPHSWIDTTASFLSLAGIAVPTFWFGMLLMRAFAVRLQLLPAAGFVRPSEDLGRSLKHLVLPATTLGLHLAATQMRFIRSSMLDVMGMDFIRTARSKGLSERAIVARHSLKNALIPVVTVFAMDIGAMLGGAIVTETVFFWPGVGTLLVTSIGKRDYPVVQAVVIFTVLIYVAINFLADMAYACLDPRIRYEAGA